MDTTTWCMLGSALLIGSAAVVTGLVGVWLPAGRRLECVLALVVGAGVGVATLGVEAAMGFDTPEEGAIGFLVASALGWIATCGTLAALVTRERRQRRADVQTSVR